MNYFYSNVRWLLCILFLFLYALCSKIAMLTEKKYINQTILKKAFSVMTRSTHSVYRYIKYNKEINDSWCLLFQYIKEIN